MYFTNKRIHETITKKKNNFQAKIVSLEEIASIFCCREIISRTTFFSNRYS